VSGLSFYRQKNGTELDLKTLPPATDILAAVADAQPLLLVAPVLFEEVTTVPSVSRSGYPNCK